ncbi:MAG TPA: hypothetical protein VHG08_29200 [Longimicrobium sp.]|nr:hypothetical protein [Longimicrobium sp.]
MKRFGTTWRKGLLGVAVAGGLGFGTAQALAMPGEATAVAPRCDDRICTFQCGAAGGREVYRGICICCLPQ